MDAQEALAEDLSRMAIVVEHEMGDTVSEEGAVTMEVVEEIHGNPEIHEKTQGDGTVYQSLLTECHVDQLLYPAPTEGWPSRFHGKKIANSKKFTNKSRQKQHRYPCHICKISFYSYFQLKVHMRNHTMISSYSCPICVKEFRYREMAKKHLTVDQGIEKAAQKDLVTQFVEPGPEE